MVDPDAMKSPPPPSAPEGHTYFRDDPGTGDTLRPNQVLMPGDKLHAVAHAPLGLPEFPLSEWATKLPLLSSTSPITFVAEFRSASTLAAHTARLLPAFVLLSSQLLLRAPILSS